MSDEENRLAGLQAGMEQLAHELATVRLELLPKLAKKDEALSAARAKIVALESKLEAELKSKQSDGHYHAFRMAKETLRRWYVGGESPELMEDVRKILAGEDLPPRPQFNDAALAQVKALRDGLPPAPDQDDLLQFADAVGHLLVGNYHPAYAAIKNRFNDKDKEIYHLNNVRERLDTENDSLQKTIDGLLTDLAEAKKQIELGEFREGGLKQQVESLKTQVQGSKDYLHSAENIYSTTHQENQKEIGRLTSSLAEARNELVKQTERAKRAEHDARFDEVELESAKRQIGELKEDLTKKTQDWVNEVTSHQASATRWSKYAESMRLEIARLKTELQNSNSREADTSWKLVELEKVNATAIRVLYSVEKWAAHDGRMPAVLLRLVSDCVNGGFKLVKTCESCTNHLLTIDLIRRELEESKKNAAQLGSAVKITSEQLMKLQSAHDAKHHAWTAAEARVEKLLLQPHRLVTKLLDLGLLTDRLRMDKRIPLETKKELADILDDLRAPSVVHVNVHCNEHDGWEAGCAVCSDSLRYITSKVAGKDDLKEMNHQEPQKEGNTFMRIEGRWCTKEEEEVLKAMANATQEQLLAYCRLFEMAHGSSKPDSWLVVVCKAELARRKIVFGTPIVVEEEVSWDVEVRDPSSKGTDWRSETDGTEYKTLTIAEANVPLGRNSRVVKIVRTVVSKFYNGVKAKEAQDGR